MSTLEFKDSPDLKTCINFKIFKVAFDLLKSFSHEIHFNKDEVLKLNCPILITEMLSPDSDEEICDTTNLHTTNDTKLISVIKELKKLGLFEEGNPKDQAFNYVFGQKPVSFFNITNAFYNKPDQNRLYVAKFENHSGRVATGLNFGLITCKWAVINDLYKTYFVDFKEGEKRAIPLSDFKAEVTKKYFEIYTYAANQVKDKDMEKLGNGEYCLGYAKTKDCYENPYIFISSNVSNQLRKRRIPIESFSSIQDFDSFIQQQLKNPA